MTTFEWGMLSATVVGLLFTAGSILGGCVWAVAKIKQETSGQIASERIHTVGLLASHAAEIARERETQDKIMGELGSSLRRHIETVDRKISEVEIWGRDNYALKNDVKESISELRDDIRTLGVDIKADLRTISAKVDSKH